MRRVKPARAQKKKVSPRADRRFIPTSSSWLNIIERGFREITVQRIRRGAFPSTDALVKAIENYIREYNKTPSPFTWTADLADVLPKIARAHEAHKMQYQ
ncbi:MAG: hypothetical protein FLDDKLPJ_00305 [Phycisphaerae bacterium]|nr:hypothetical protein [Phycisphaerae bacterium]